MIVMLEVGSRVTFETVMGLSGASTWPWLEKRNDVHYTPYNRTCTLKVSIQMFQSTQCPTVSLRLTPKTVHRTSRITMIKRQQFCELSSTHHIPIMDRNT